MLSNLQSYQGKKVLITGDTGFKGSWLAFWLAELGADVYGYALPPEPHQRLFHDLKLPERITHVDGDICNFSAMEKVFLDVQPEYVFHLAAQALVRDSYSSPKYTFDVNVAGSVNVLELVRHTESVRSLVYVTSDKCYKNKEWLWGYRENDELGGHDPYSASKAAAEVVFSSYVDSFFALQDRVGVASARAGNVIGGGDWSEDRIVPDCMRAWQENQCVTLRNPNAVRPWQHVLEPLSGYLLLGAKLYESAAESQGSWNFGPNAASVQTVEVLVKRLSSLWENSAYEIEVSKGAVHEAGLLTLNCDKAHQLLGWRPCWDFMEGLNQTMNWYQSMLANKIAAVDITRKQVNLYMENMA